MLQMEEYTSEDTIFVQIASYRDSELQYTLQDLFAKAKRPENIFVGICHQYDMKGDEDKHLFEIPFTKPKQLRIDEVDYRESQGCCWARNRVQKLCKDEKWTLMIDSHTRFEKDWDNVLVNEIKEQIKKNETNKIVLTAYAAGFDYNNENQRDVKYSNNIYGMKLSFDSGCVKCIGVSAIKKYISIAGFSAGFAFSTTNFIKIIPYDTKLFFLGEEPTIALRLFTNGWKILNFNKNIIYHLYNNKKTANGIKTRPINSNEKLNNISKLRQQHLFCIQKTRNKEALQDLDKYNLGTKRTLRDYERFSGIDFRRKTTREHTKQGIFEDWQEVSKKNKIKKLFNKIYGLI